jgi:signal transduction histidine kinase/ActR/RegA family two-component response regulator
MTCQDEYDLVEAAPAKTLALYVEQIDKLDRSMLAARANKSLEAEAIATEQMAQIYLECSKEKVAAVYLQDAYDLYARAGATTKIDYLEYSYPHLLNTLRSPQQVTPTNYFTDEFIATLSHEFRNPLNGILGMSEALLEEVFGTMNERQLNAVTTIDRSGGYLLALIENMVDLSQLQAGKLELEISYVSVAELCNFSANFVKHHAIQKQIQLDTEIPPDAGYIPIDLRRMRQVLIDLLDRAIDATPVGGKVRLVVTMPTAVMADAPSVMQFSVIDTSKEISPARNDRFAQFSATMTDDRRIGFGLMLAHPIVELHGGSIDFQNAIGNGNGTTKGRGSCVNVFLPSLCSDSDAPTLDDTFDRLRHPNGYPEDIATCSETIVQDLPDLPLILIVEDNELNINTISSYLTAKGYRPIVAGDGESAIELTQKFRPDLILMDIQMPGMDGFEAISCIRQQPELAKIPIIALTALAMEGDREKCLAVGANEYLTKPVKLKQLNTTIQQFLNSKIDIDTLSGDLWQ